MTTANTLQLLKGNSRLSEQNKNLIHLMASKLNDMVKKDSKNTSVFEMNGFVKSEFIAEVAKETNVNEPTVSRIFYTYINKKTNDVLQELAGETQNKLEEVEQEKSTKQKVVLGEKIISIYEDDNKLYFILDELLSKIPISKNNDAMKNAFAVRGRKILLVNGQKRHCIEVEKVKLFLQSFIKNMPECEKKNKFRLFIEELFRLNLDKKQPVTRELPKLENVNPPVQIQNKSNKEKNETHVKTQIQKTERVNAPMNKQKSTNVAKELPKVMHQDKASQLEINEDKEIYTLIRLLSDKIGYLSDDAKTKLVEVAKREGLVKATMSTLKVIEQIDDIGMHFVNKIDRKANECL